MLISFIRTMILYTILIVVIRLMGKRQLGEMEPMEFVVTMLLANLAAVPMQETGIPLLSGLIPILDSSRSWSFCRWSFCCPFWSITASAREGFFAASPSF